MDRNTRFRALLVVLAVGGIALAPSALGTLTGSGLLNDVVSLTTTTGTLAAATLTTTDGSPVASGSAFHVTNSISNVDTFIRYDWSSSPYFGATSTDTSIALRGTTYYISDLLYFKQETINGVGTTTTSDVFAPLVIKNAASVSRATFTAAGNACTAWTGSAAGGFSATAAGSFTFRYYLASAQTDDTPSTSITYYYCLDTTNSQTYLHTSASFTGATLVKKYTSDSVGGVLNTYQYELATGQSNGNKYCLTAYTGAGTSATPDLAMCEKLAFGLLNSAAGKLYPLFDPPDAFPSSNQEGAANTITYSIAGTQWNPYAYTTTNSA